MNKNELVAIRDLLPEDRNFILATFLRGLYYGDSHYSEMSKAVFMQQYHDIADGILTFTAAYSKVACLREDPSVILGYALMNKEQTVLHWAFCKKAWRGIGIAKALVPPTITTVSHLTKPGLSIMKAKGYEFNPFAV